LKEFRKNLNDEEEERNQNAEKSFAELMEAMLCKREGKNVSEVNSTREEDRSGEAGKAAKREGNTGPACKRHVSNESEAGQGESRPETRGAQFQNRKG